ncbi:519_t:CDS:2, partial [Ambispora leptoticha]
YTNLSKSWSLHHIKLAPSQPPTGVRRGIGIALDVAKRYHYHNGWLRRGV